MIDKYVALAKIQDEAVARDLFINTAFWCNKFLQDAPKAKKYAQMALDLGGLDPQAKEFLEGILEPEN